MVREARIGTRIVIAVLLVNGAPRLLDWQMLTRHLDRDRGRDDRPAHRRQQEHRVRRPLGTAALMIARRRALIL
jgi:hypothetical protein